LRQGQILQADVLGIYLPIAELSANLFVLLSIGAGGGFLITPLLILYNIPPAVAVGTGANQVIATSLSGALAHVQRRTIDYKLGIYLLFSGILGSTLGATVFSILKRLGQLDLAISLLYVVFLGIIGSLMLWESAGAALRKKKDDASAVVTRPGISRNWIHKLPLKVRFSVSRIYISIIPVIALGTFIGFLSSIMGVGGGFIMVPAMIYLLRVPTNVVVGTSLFQIIFVSAYTTLVHAMTNNSVDVVLAACLMVGGVAGAQYGASAGQKLRGEQLRSLLAILVLAVALRLAYGLFVTPDDLFTITSPVVS
jgi:uncharacterized protein